MPNEACGVQNLPLKLHQELARICSNQQAHAGIGHMNMNMKRLYYAFQYNSPAINATS